RRVLFRSVLDPRDRCSARPLAAHPVISFESPHHSVPPPPPCGERLRSHHRCASCTLPSSDIIRLISGAGWQSFPAQQIWTSLFPVRAPRDRTNPPKECINGEHQLHRTDRPT